MQVQVRQDMPAESVAAVWGHGDDTRLWLNGKYGEDCWREALAHTDFDADQVLAQVTLSAR